MLKTFTRPAMIFIPFLLGVLFPQAHVLNDPPYNAVRWALAVMVFLSCLQIRFSELKPRREHWHLLGMNLLMGIVPYFALRLLIPGSAEETEDVFVSSMVVHAVHSGGDCAGIFYRESAGFALEHCGHCSDFGTHLHLQLLVREISCAETLPPGVQPAARAEEHDIHDVSGTALCQCAGGDGTDFLHCLPQHLERMADVPVRPPEISASEAARCIPAGGAC